MRAELGGVQFTPTILMVFYGDGGVSRAKFEGMGEIMDGMSTYVCMHAFHVLDAT